MKTNKHAYYILFFLTSLVFFPTALKAQAPTSITHFYPDAVKGYSTEGLFPSDDFVMAGTIYKSGANSKAHFYRFASAITITRSFEIANRDIVVADIAVYDQVSYITCLLRDPVGTVNPRDRILVLCVDWAGNIANQWTLTSGNATDDRNMYPLHSLWHNGRLYISGYVTDQQNIGPPLEPNFAQQKKALVICFNPTAVPTATVNGRVYDYTFGTPGVSPSDFDIAMRLSSVGNRVHVAGSCNVVTTNSFSSADEFPSGTLSIFLNPPTGSGNGFTTVSNKPFVLSGAIGDPNGNGRGEYGVGIIPDPSTQGYFVLGNDFYPNLALQGGYKVLPAFFWLTYLNSAFEPPTGVAPFSNRKRSAWDYAWATHVMTGEDSQHFILAGMTVNTPFGMSCGKPVPTFDNVNPFMNQVFPRWLGNSVNFGEPNIYVPPLSPNPFASPRFYYKIYNSKLGTGVQTAANSYWQLGGGLANIAWNPTFAAKEYGNAIGSDIVMTALVMNPFTNQLNLKTLRTDFQGNMPGCPLLLFCPPEHYQEFVAQKAASTPTMVYNIIPVANHPIQIQQPVVVQNNYFYTADHTCNAGYYKVSSAEEFSGPAEVKLSPNPARSQVEIVINNIDPERSVTIMMYNMQGQEVARLYKGAAASLQGNKLNLPELAAGMYLIKIIDGSQMLAHEKLVIE